MKNFYPNFQRAPLNGIKLSGLLLSSSLLLLLAGGWMIGFPGMVPEIANSNEPQALAMGESEVFLTVNWPNFASENQVELYNSANQLLLTVCNPSNCFVDINVNDSYSATVPAGCQLDGGGYYLVLRDAFGDAWQGSGTVQVEDVSGNVLLGPITHSVGSVTTSGTFMVSGGGASCVPPVDPNDICVNVFHDYNSNGLDDGAGEVGFAGLTVTAYDAANNSTVLTDNGDGNYVFTPGNSNTYRVEVTGLPAGLEPSVAGATTVLFINRGNKAEVALHYPAEHYNDDGVFVVTPCYVDGPSNGANANGDVLVIVPTGELAGGIGNQSPTEYFIADHNQIGATFGVAYSRPANSLFAAAFTKRHTAFGPGGTGAIYRINLNGTTSPLASTGVSTFINLNSIFGANTAGVDPHPNTGTDFNRDPLAYDAVGKVGLGGLAMSETGNVLWTINLADRRLYEMQLGGTLENPTAPTAGDISRWPASGDLTDLPGLPGNANQRDDNIRPFAVKCHRGNIYIGLVATGESSVVANANQSTVNNTGDRSLLRGYVYKFDPITDVFTQVLDFPLNYVREQAVDFCSNNGQAEFNPWTPVYDAATFEAAVMGTSGASGSLLPERVYPQAWITDIEFDEFGRMIIGLRDRFADQHGFNKQPPSTAGSDPNTFFNADGAGDILLASITADNTTYVIENNSSNGAGGAAFGPTTGAGFGEGPGGGEFFFDDRYRPANATPDGGGLCPAMSPDPNDQDPQLDPQLEQGHDEIVLGGLFQYNGTRSGTITGW